MGLVDSEAIGGIPTNGQDAVPADIASVNALVKGIREMVGVALKDKGDANATKTNNAQQITIGKLFGQKSSNDGDETHAAAASASIGAVTGADILRAISKSGDAKTQNLNAVTNAAEIAVATKASQNLNAAVKNDAVIAAGIALRAMAKDGKFSAKQSEEKSAHAVNAVAASAVNKILSTLIIAIRNTVDTGLKKISETLAGVKQEDLSSETIEASTVTK